MKKEEKVLPKIKGQNGSDPVAGVDRKMRKLRYAIDLYDALLRSKGEINGAARVLNLDGEALHIKIHKSVGLSMILELAKKRADESGAMSEYVYKSLTPEAKEMWDRLKSAGGNDERKWLLKSINRKRIRQELFVHALICSTFNASRACQMVGVAQETLRKWKRDANFMMLLEEVQFHKKNFFENALVGLVQEKHAGAVIFANRTLNADRGYSERMKIEHSGAVDVGAFSFDDLDLDIDTKRKVLEAIRLKRVREQVEEAKKNAIEVNGEEDKVVESGHLLMSKINPNNGDFDSEEELREWSAA